MDYSFIKNSLLSLPVLSREEEAGLGRNKNILKKRIEKLENKLENIKDKREKRNLNGEIKKLKEEYRELADYFISHNLKLPFYFIKEFHVPESEFADYILEGNSALYRAFNYWNPEMAKFSTYVGRVIKNIYLRLNKKRDYRGKARAVSLERNSEGKGLIGCLEEESEEISLGLEKEDRNKILHEAISSLGRRERIVIESRYGLNGYGILSLEESGRLIQVTKEGARQIQLKAVEKLRKYMVNRYGKEANLIL